MNLRLLGKLECLLRLGHSVDAWAQDVYWPRVLTLMRSGKVVRTYEKMGLLRVCPRCGATNFIDTTPEQKWPGGLE